MLAKTTTMNNNRSYYDYPSFRALPFLRDGISNKIYLVFFPKRIFNYMRIFRCALKTFVHVSHTRSSKPTVLR